MVQEYILAVSQLNPGPGGDSNIKVTEMLLVSLRGINCRFWSQGGIIWGDGKPLYLPLQVSLSVVQKKLTKNAVTLTTQKFLLGVSLSLYHTHIGLLQGFNLGFSFNFLTSIPVTSVWESFVWVKYRESNNAFFRGRLLRGVEAKKNYSIIC